jgi:hypothetical protein
MALQPEREGARHERAAREPSLRRALDELDRLTDSPWWGSEREQREAQDDQRCLPALASPAGTQLLRDELGRLVARKGSGRGTAPRIARAGTYPEQTGRAAHGPPLAHWSMQDTVGGPERLPRHQPASSRTRMQLKHNLAATALLALSFLVSPARADEMPEVGAVAPEINAKTWFNQLGAEPTLASLRGSAVMIEFWATW